MNLHQIALTGSCSTIGREWSSNGIQLFPTGNTYSSQLLLVLLFVFPSCLWKRLVISPTFCAHTCKLGGGLKAVSLGRLEIDRKQVCPYVWTCAGMVPYPIDNCVWMWRQKMSTLPVNHVCVLNVIQLCFPFTFIQEKMRQGHWHHGTGASFECVGWVGDMESVHSQCAGGSQGGPLMNIWIEKAGKKKSPLRLNISSSLTFTSHTSACVCGHCRSQFV